ncbi:hypothetical protein [Rhodomicrobium sp.]|uniref:hypothetical protein n=1 Tax=Rhodomicrobium sp. TaxID=2720632 RepID=UPI0039E3A5AB
MTEVPPAKAHPHHHKHRHGVENASLRFESEEPPLRKRRGFGRPHALVVIGTVLSLAALLGFVLIPYVYKAFG